MLVQEHDNKSVQNFTDKNVFFSLVLKASGVRSCGYNCVNCWFQCTSRVEVTEENNYFHYTGKRNQNELFSLIACSCHLCSFYCHSKSVTRFICANEARYACFLSIVGKGLHFSSSKHLLCLNVLEQH